MTDIAQVGRSSLKDRFSARFLHFFKDHPIYVKAYVPTIVTATLAMQVVQTIRGWC